MTAASACCDLHGRNCEPPSELCCENCTEARHGGWRDERGTWRFGHPVGEACSAPDLSAFGTRVGLLVSKGYGAHPCPPHCPDNGNEGHVHMTSPDGLDFIAWADGTSAPFDLTRNSGIIAPVMTPRRH